MITVPMRERRGTSMVSSYLTISRQTGATHEFRLPTLVSRSGRARILEPTHARTAQMTGGPVSWPGAGTMSAQRPAAQQHQGGAIAGFGRWDVTDTKFSTRLGPPSCSPPV
jgi:hypothetical protein